MVFFNKFTQDTPHAQSILLVGMSVVSSLFSHFLFSFLILCSVSPCFLSRSLPSASVTLKSETNFYWKHYRRKPFVGFQKWIHYARELNCSTHPKFYQMIENTLNHFRNFTNPNQRTITKEQLEMASKLMMVRMIVMNNGSLFIDRDDQWLSFLKDFEDVLPSNFRMYLNLEDEPRVAPLYSYDEKIVNQHNLEEKRQHLPNPINRQTYSSVKNIFDLNHCFQQKHDASRTSFAAFFSDEYFNQVSFHLIPIFSQSSNDCFVDLMIPGSDHFKFSLRQHQHQNLPPWNKKIPQVMWRGSTHGVYWAPDLQVPFWRGQRQRLLETVLSLKAQNHSICPYLNISFSRYAACHPTICQEMLRRYGPPSPLSYIEQMKYKYILDIDGIAWTGRFMPSLGDTSVILKATYCHEFFTPFVLPYVHYIPLDREYRDFVEQIEWAFNNDDLVQRIVKQANQLSRKHLRNQDLKCYTSRMVLEYASLLQEDIPPVFV
jgi:hypothetical protein